MSVGAKAATRTYEELCRAVEVAVPGAAIEENDDGELVIYTGLTQEGYDVRPMTQDEINDGVRP